MLEHEGFNLLPQTSNMEAYLPAPGVFTKTKPTEEELEDIEYGAKVAEGLKLDIKEVERLAGMPQEERAKATS